jgi:GT2 family glycosyltransferase
MNNDTVVVPWWMSEMLECFEEKENVGMVCPTFWGSGAKQSVDWGTEPRFDYVDNIFSIIGVCFLIPRTVLDKIGNWCEEYGHGGEDFDICKRIQDAGYDIYVARKSFIYHYGGASTRVLADNDFAKAKQNQIDKLKIFSKKHNIPMEEIMSRINLSNTI